MIKLGMRSVVLLAVMFATGGVGWSWSDALLAWLEPDAKGVSAKEESPVDERARSASTEKGQSQHGRRARKEPAGEIQEPAKPTESAKRSSASTRPTTTSSKTSPVKHPVARPVFSDRVLPH